MNWLKERFRDLALWPLNLVRDFPRRNGRFLQTLHSGLKTARHLPAELQKAKQKRNGIKRLGNWLHLLLVQLFDLVGGPEIVQFWLHLLTYTTPLTPTEIKMMQTLLGEKGMRYQDIRVAQGGLMKYVFQNNGNLAFATWYTINLPQYHGGNVDLPTRQNLPIVVHELTHVYQYHTVGSRYMSEAIYVLIKHKRNCYAYGGGQGLAEALHSQLTMADFNREQQAQIVQDYFARTEAGREVHNYLPFIIQMKAGRL